tara:strand:+ start:2048 stop:2794 length:747 start_codon:yes stop_codon:yes gene_type:complete
MRLKTGLNLSKNYSYNFSLPKRRRKNIKFIILHYTGMKKEASALKRLCDKKSKVSAHYFVKENGKVVNLVPDLYEAWHAGKSNWKNFKSINKYSIGIEISNPGHKNGYKNFTSKQISSIKKLLKFLIRKYDLKYHNILGHSDIAPSRKKDPGEKFPWSLLAKQKLCLWHNLIEKKIKTYRNIRLSSLERNFFFINLKRIGYSKIQGMNSQKSNKYIIKAFQRRFRQELVNGKIDKECYLISDNILQKI